jgi:hypothetical protein
MTHSAHKQKLFTLSKFITIILFLAVSLSAHSQLGAYAGNYKKWLKKEVEVQKEAAFFKGHQLGTFMLVLDDAEMEYFLYVYEKGTTSIILLVTKIKDALSYTIQDVIEVKNVLVKDNIQTGTCSTGGNYDAKIAVLEKNIKGKPVNTKAWRADIDRLHFKSISPKGINCIIED